MPSASRIANSTPIHLPFSKAAPKRSRTDEGTKSSPYVIDSDNEDAPHLQLARKRNKSSRILHDHAQTAQQVPMPTASQAVEDESSDDEPLIARMQARGSGVVRGVIPADLRSPPGEYGDSAKSSPRAAVSRPAPQSALAMSVPPPNDKLRIVSALSSPVRAPALADTPSSFSPLSQTSFPLCGEQTNLKSAFESLSKTPVSKAPTVLSPRAPKAAAANSFDESATRIGPSPLTSANGSPLSLRRRVPTPDRLFTNMSVSNFNKLILTMPRVRTEDSRIGAKKRAYTTALLKGNSAKKTGPRKRSGSGKRMGTSATGRVKATGKFVGTVMTGEDDLDLVSTEVSAMEAADHRFTGTRNDMSAEFGENNNSLIESEDGLPVTRTVTKTKTSDQVHMSLSSRIAQLTSLQTLPSQVQVLLDSVPAVKNPLLFQFSGATNVLAKPITHAQASDVSRASHATPVSSTIDLTDDEAYAPAPSQGDSRSSPALPEPATALSASTERPEHTKLREEEFMRGFKTKYWLGGFSFRDTLLEVNAANPLSIMRFSQEEGERRLHSLAGQGKLAIRHELVYHLEEDPGLAAPHPSEVKKSQKPLPTTPVQKVKEEREDSPYGRISAARFQTFTHWLNGNVQVGYLFNNKKKEDTLGNCFRHLNEYLGGPGEEKKLSLQEISAAFVHLQKIGDVVLEGEMIRFLNEEEKAKLKRKSKKRR